MRPLGLAVEGLHPHGLSTFLPVATENAESFVEGGADASGYVWPGMGGRADAPEAEGLGHWARRSAWTM